jgi:hypothetical protein
MTLRQETPDESPRMDDAKALLVHRLEEACRTGLSDGPPETTGELLRLEDALVAAARATEDMLELRRQEKVRKRARRKTTDVEVESEDDRAERLHGDEEVPLTQGQERIREFKDATGAEWRAWAVIPGLASPSAQRHLGELRHGWLAFEALDGSARRRLVHYPSNWMTLSESELTALLAEAAEAPVRKKLPPIE